MCSKEDNAVNIKNIGENKDKRSLFFYAVSRGDFLFTVRKITRRFIAGTSAMRALSSAALVSRGPTEIFCLTELFII